MGLSLGNIVKGAVTGLETLLETGNPIAAAGAGAISAFGGGCGGPIPTFNPLLDEMSGNLNPGSRAQVYSYSQLAGLEKNGQSPRGASPDLGSVVDGDDVGDDGLAV